MNRVKLFSNSPYYVQKEIDEWMDKNPSFEIISATSSINSGDVVTTIVYNDGTLPKFETIK